MLGTAISFVENNNTEIKYKPNRKWYLIIYILISFILCTFIYAIFKYPYLNISRRDILLDTALAAGTLFYMLLPALGMIVTLLQGKVLCRSGYFLLKKRMSVDNIAEITYPPTFGVGNTHRTLTIIAEEESGPKEIMMSYPAFTKQTLSDVVTDLKIINPDIRISDDAQALLGTCGK